MLDALNGLALRVAEEADVPGIRALLADDALGAAREDMSDSGLKRYYEAYRAIAADSRNELMVACLEGRIVGTYQVTYIPYLSRGGNERALIEAVRVASDRRGAGIGAAMMRHAMGRARSRGCLMMQLTTDTSRADAHRFYERLGFVASHHGMKLAL